MHITRKSWLSLVLGTALAGGALAAELAGLAPLTGSAFGHQSDASTPAYTQAFVSPAGASVLEAIRWWGFHVEDPPLGLDNFLVTLDGVAVSGALTVASTSSPFDEYTLDIPDVALTASTLGIFNDSLDVQWYWQSAQAVGNSGAPDAANVAFSLIGRQGVITVDEPSDAALALAAFAALALIRRRTTGRRPG